MSNYEVLNEKQTQIMQNDPKMKLYVEWAKQNGVIMDKIIFPAAFGPDNSPLMGSAAREDIAYNEAYVYIPNKILITVERARSSEIGHIFDNHDAIFKSNQDRDFLTLLLFLIYEHQKADKSFWYPYFSAVDPGKMTCYWDPKYIKALDDRELRDQLIEYKDQMDKDWDTMLKILKVYPELFNLDICTFDLYQRCATFIATRCFGWGLPSTVLAPIADSFNHNPQTNNTVDLLNKRLHLMQNKIYAYHFNFDSDSSKGDDPYDKTTSKLKYNAKRLFKEDQLDSDQQALIQGEQPDEDILKNRYDDQEVFNRFKNLLKDEQASQQDDLESEEQKKEKFPNHGLELWGLGYVSSEHEQDDDSDAEEEDADESYYNEELKRKIFQSTEGQQEELTMEEFESISSNSRLREIYSYRWWQDQDQDNYFVMVARELQGIKAGSQIFYNYGRRTNSHLLQNYGFTLGCNKYASFELRVTLSTNPKAVINHPGELLPEEKVLQDRENIQTTTERIKIQENRISEGLMGYLRSVLQNNYQGQDQEYIMVSTPRVIAYELIVVEFALDLLEEVAKELFAKSTLQKDQQDIENEKDYKMMFIKQYNIQRKQIFLNQIKLLKVLKHMLEQLSDCPSPHLLLTHVCFQRAPHVEAADSEEQLFLTRMGMRMYFKELKMNLLRIDKAKKDRAKDKQKQIKKKVDKLEARQQSPDKKASSQKGKPVMKKKKK